MASFIKERLRQARELRGLTKTSLSMLSQVSVMSLSHYESGTREPRQDSLTRLANALSLPESFFCKPMPDRLETPVYFRALRRQKKIFQEQWEQHSALLDELLDEILNYVDIPKLNIPQLSLGEHWATVEKNKIEQAAYKTRELLGLKFGPIPNMIKLLENNGCLVVRLDMDSSEDGFSRWLHGGTIPVVFLSKNTTAYRDRMSMAHELGHLVLHRHITPADTNLKIIEEQAWLFASAFLMPEKGYARDFSYASLDTFRILKQKWKISIAAQVRRCLQLNIISEQAHKNIQINLSRKGWRTCEPYDETTPLEAPNLLEASADIIFKQLCISLEQISNLGALDVIRLLGLEQTYFDRIGDERILPKNKILKFTKYEK
ncbi:helix-turn-helix domain-containing protein [Bilophila wadsworthia]|uniref:helix-turn-helix domain-containing protein n=1 Tax=Bilophila wadsworthia TaxID=35833 RepID=UPI0009DCCC0F|nr:XRE family transcriptional regulator [Bilophila wadsworthia]